MNTTMKRRIETTEKMMEYLRKCGCKVCGTAEEFYNHPLRVEGIWISAESSYADDGSPLFDYYHENFELYDIGVEKALAEAVNRKGWYFEWYDAGTMMLYKDKN